MEGGRMGSGSYSYTAADHYYAWDVEIDASEWDLYDDPASESVITVSADSDRELSVLKWVAAEIGEDGEKLGIVDYPFGDAGSSLSTTVNGQILAGLVSEGSDVEIFAVVGDENGLEETTDSVYISIRRGVENIYCNVEDINILPGEEYSLPVYVTASVVNMDYPDGKEMDCGILGANIEDPSVAEVSFGDGML